MNELRNININENDLNSINQFYSDISTNFNNSIKLNYKFKKEIEDIYARTLLNFGKSALSIFHLKYIMMFESLAEYYDDDEELVEFSNSLISVINDYFEDLNSNLNIKSKHDLDNLNYIINISLFLLEEVMNDKNIELAYESFFQIERKINKKKLYKKSDNSKMEISIRFNNDNSIEIKGNMTISNFNSNKNHLGEFIYEV